MSVNQANDAHVEVATMDRLGNTSAPDARVGACGQEAKPEDSSAPQWPVVTFTNGDTICCPPSMFDVTNARGFTEASREQVS